MQLEGVQSFLAGIRGFTFKQFIGKGRKTYNAGHAVTDAELVLDVVVRSRGDRGEVTSPVHTTGQTFPVEFEVNNVRSVVEVELDRQGASLQGHRIPIDTKVRSGWGSVGLPGDSNPLDNQFFFVFSEPTVRRSAVVSDDAKNGEAFRRALAIPTDPRLQHRVDVISVDRVAEIDWESNSTINLAGGSTTWGSGGSDCAIR